MKQEKGFSLIEVMLAMALLGIIAIAFLGALATGSKAIFIADERATAESLARSQMEYVKNQDYIDYSVTGHEEYEEITLPSNYDVELSVSPFDPDTGDPYDEAGGVFDQDDGIQRIKVTIKHLEKPEVIVPLEDYKSWQ